MNWLSSSDSSVPVTIISIALAVFILGGLVFLHIRASKRK